MRNIFLKKLVFSEIDSQICISGLIHYLNSYEMPNYDKKLGIFENF